MTDEPTLTGTIVIGTIYFFVGMFGYLLIRQLLRRKFVTLIRPKPTTYTIEVTSDEDARVKAAMLCASLNVTLHGSIEWRKDGTGIMTCKVVK